MAIPKDGFYNFLWPLPFQTGFTNELDRPNILSNHARFNSAPLRELMPKGTQYVTILRNPLTQFSSLFKFMDLGRILNFKSRREQVSMKYFLNNAYEILKSLHQYNPQALIDNPSLYLLRNPQLFDLGFEPSFSEDKNRINKEIAAIDNHFNLILIMEYFDESLVLLKRRMCWDLDDVVYFKHNVQVEGKNDELPSVKEKILRWAGADVNLYNYFNKSLWDRIKKEESNFWEEVALLRWKNKKLTESCLKKGIFFDRPYAGSNSLIYGHSLKTDIPPNLKQICERMTRSEIQYIEYFQTTYKTKLSS